MLREDRCQARDSGLPARRARSTARPPGESCFEGTMIYAAVPVLIDSEFLSFVISNMGLIIMHLRGFLQKLALI